MPHDRDALLVLVEKVRAAKGPDQEIDCDLAVWFGYDCSPSLHQWRLRELWSWQDIPAFTDSLDAATTLMEGVLPGWDYHLWRDNDYDGQYVAEMIWPKGALTPDAGYFGCDGRAATRALAIVHGILESKIALLAQAEAEAGGQHAQ